MFCMLLFNLVNNIFLLLYILIVMFMYSDWNRGSTVVKVLCYKSEGRSFDPID